MGTAIRELTEGKPIVFTDRADAGYFIKNVGDAFAANVWYVVPGEPPVPLGALGKGESAPFPNEPADRHLLIAEARPISRRKWTLTMNVRVGASICHGFVGRDAEVLEYRGSLTGYLALVPDIFQRLEEWDPLSAGETESA